MSKLRLRHSSTPARLYDIENWDEFGRNGEVRLTFTYNGISKDFTIGYTKPFRKKQENIYENVINLNQNRQTSPELKKEFQDWQNQITHNGSTPIDILDFHYFVISR